MALISERLLVAARAASVVAVLLLANAAAATQQRAAVPTLALHAVDISIADDVAEVRSVLDLSSAANTGMPTSLLELTQEPALRSICRVLMSPAATPPAASSPGRTPPASADPAWTPCPCPVASLERNRRAALRQVVRSISVGSPACGGASELGGPSQPAWLEIISNYASPESATESSSGRWWLPLPVPALLAADDAESMALQLTVTLPSGSRLGSPLPSRLRRNETAFQPQSTVYAARLPTPIRMVAFTVLRDGGRRLDLPVVAESLVVVGGVLSLAFIWIAVARSRR